MIERGLKPQHLSVGKQIDQIVAENQRELAKEQAAGRKAFPTIRPELDRQRRRTITVR